MPDPAIPNYLARPGEPERIGPGRDYPQQLFLNSGRLLVFGGTFIIIYTVGNPSANAEHVFTGFLLVLLGVSLVPLSAVASRFPRTARVGAAVANAVLNYLFGRQV